MKTLKKEHTSFKPSITQSHTNRKSVSINRRLSITTKPKPLGLCRPIEKYPRLCVKVIGPKSLYDLKFSDGKDGELSEKKGKKKGKSVTAEKGSSGKAKSRSHKLSDPPRLFVRSRTRFTNVGKNKSRRSRRKLKI